jgi:hypothetical protein
MQSGGPRLDVRLIVPRGLNRLGGAALCPSSASLFGRLRRSQSVSVDDFAEELLKAAFGLRQAIGSKDIVQVPRNTALKLVDLLREAADRLASAQAQREENGDTPSQA